MSVPPCFIEGRLPQVDKMNDDKIVEELKKATAGLLVMSESDYLFEVIQWNGQTAITPEYLVRLSGTSSSRI